MPPIDPEDIYHDWSEGTAREAFIEMQTGSDARPSPQLSITQNHIDTFVIQQIQLDAYQQAKESMLSLVEDAIETNDENAKGNEE